MATIKGSILGKISGKMGDYSLRIRNGKNYVASTPVSFNMPMDDASINRRKKFSLAAKWASIINADPQLKNLWLNFLPAGSSVFNFVLKSNVNLFDPDQASSLVSIMPAIGFPVTSVSSSFAEDAVNLEITAISGSSSFDVSIETNMKLFPVLFLSGKLDENLPEFKFINLNNAAEALVLDQNLIYNIPLNLFQQSLIEKYSKVNVYYALATLDADENIIQFSNTLLS